MNPTPPPAGTHSTARKSLSLGLLLVVLALTVAASAHAQSLWPTASTRGMFSDKRACSVGDIITIIVKESTTATKNNQTATSKKASMDASIATFLYNGYLANKGAMPALKYSSDNEFTGGGTINNNESIVAEVAVKVIDVLPNRTLVIEGTRETSFAGEKQNIVLHGIVRADDVASDNTCYSYNIADAKITIVGKGAVSDAQRKGWFTKIWDKISPF